MQNINLYMIVSVAFLSSFSHCVGMCSGFLSLQTLFFKGKSKREILMLSTLYSLARIFAYVVLGALFGAFGAVISFSMQVRGLIFFIIGLMIAFIGIALLFRGELLKFVENQKVLNFVVRIAKTRIQKKNLANFLLLGFLNGFLPCGVVYYFLALGILSANFINSAFIMLVFGLCTLPAMLLASFVFGILNEKFKDIMFKISASIMIINGIYLSFLGYRANA
ncbi:sulfite exporter TauE/SafE family protein [Campylobacter concisus]|uniref:Putative membrane protein (DsbD domain) n=1 Tax=Campylobacter concisus TaxID=199 RepID=A0A0M4SGB8_9BACT|nr:sulfite exporter TauE/SafE family protein [Campylobacter concisus]ALF47003.1 putative membrane protein (DsbD domain) [Campylobacter concisus]